MATRLQLVRQARGWSQTRLIFELSRRAEQSGVALPEPSSLKAQLSRWENGRVTPDETYRRLLREVYGVGDQTLGFARGGGAATNVADDDDLEARLTGSRALGREAARLFGEQTEALRQLDRLQGGAVLLEQMRLHVQNIDVALRFSVRLDQRRELAGALSDASALAGWQALDTGAFSRSWRYFELAKESAREAESRPLMAFALAEQAYVLLDLGHADSALAQLCAALDLYDRQVPASMRCWLRAARAEMAAARGNDSGSMHDLDDAASLLSDEVDEPRLPYVALGESDLLRWRGHCLAVLGAEEAVVALNDVLTRSMGLTVRAEAGLRCDLVTAVAARGDERAAAREAVQARAVARRAGSVRQQRRLEALLKDG